MKKILKNAFLFSYAFFLLACSKRAENNPEPFIALDPIVGQWNEVLDQGSPYQTIVWTFTPEGDLQLLFDDNDTADGEWTALSSPANGYSFSFQQYPDATKRTFFLTLIFSANNSTVNISDDSSTFHWVRNRALNRIQ